MNDAVKPSQLNPGSTIGPYRISKILGAGGMGTVFDAIQLSLNRRVALKVLKSSRLQAPGAIDNFLAEAAHTARLNHPHLVQVHDAGRCKTTGMVYYAMQLVRGMNLRQFVARNGPLPADKAITILGQCAAGLGHAHQAGLVHRDLKPENIVIADDGHTAHITDLGLAMDKLGGRQALNNAKSLIIIGTPEYTAPEQSRNPHKAIPASDVFSLGCVLFFMLRGHDPFDGETLIDLIVRIATEEPAALSQLPIPMRDLLALLMHKDARKRPANGDEAAKRIKAQLSSNAVAKRTAMVRRQAARRKRR